MGMGAVVCSGTYSRHGNKYASGLQRGMIYNTLIFPSPLKIITMKRGDGFPCGKILSVSTYTYNSCMLCILIVNVPALNRDKYYDWNPCRCFNC